MVRSGRGLLHLHLNDHILCGCVRTRSSLSEQSLRMHNGIRPNSATLRLVPHPLVQLPLLTGQPEGIFTQQFTELSVSALLL